MTRVAGSAAREAAVVSNHLPKGRQSTKSSPSLPVPGMVGWCTELLTADSQLLLISDSPVWGSARKGHTGARCRGRWHLPFLPLPHPFGQTDAKRVFQFMLKQTCKRGTVGLFFFTLVAEMECPPHTTYTHCMSACPASCANMAAQSTCTAPCVEGCASEPGYVFSGLDSVPYDQCGCTSNNHQYYQVGASQRSPGFHARSSNSHMDPGKHSSSFHLTFIVCNLARGGLQMALLGWSCSYTKGIGVGV